MTDQTVDLVRLGAWKRLRLRLGGGIGKIIEVSANKIDQKGKVLVRVAGTGRMRPQNSRQKASKSKPTLPTMTSTDPQ